jgi:hypothetical protein
VDGLLFDPNANESIRSAVETILSHDEVAGQFAAAGRKKALACSHPSKIAARHLEIYQEVLLRR